MFNPPQFPEQNLRDRKFAFHALLAWIVLSIVGIAYIAITRDDLLPLAAVVCSAITICLAAIWWLAHTQVAGPPANPQ